MSRSVTYNAAGQRTNLVYPGSTWLTTGTGEVVTYTYNAAGRLHTLSDWEDGVTVYTYTAAWRLSGMSLPNGVTTQYGYDVAGRLVDLEHRGPVGARSLYPPLLAHYAYELDGVGNRVRVEETVAQPIPAPAARGSMCRFRHRLDEERIVTPWARTNTVLVLWFQTPPR